jgi:hypothetical protein
VAQTILIKRSNTDNAVPSTLQVGELAANMYDMRLWIGTPDGVKEFGIVPTAALAFLSHCSVSGDGLPLWNGTAWGSALSADGIGSMTIGSTFVVG